MTHRTRLHVEALEDRRTPSASLEAPPAFHGLDVAVARFIPGDPVRPLAVAPVFALNYGPAPETLPALDGLVKAGYNGPPISPVFFGLGGESPMT